MTNDQRMVPVELLRNLAGHTAWGAGSYEHSDAIRDALRDEKQARAIISGPGVEPVAWATVADNGPQKYLVTASPGVRDAWLYDKREVIALAAPSAPQIALPDGLHEETKRLVVQFATAMAEKLYAAELKYGYSNGWAYDDWMDECRTKLLEHLAKGDPRDVANYCAFLWYHKEPTIAPSAPVQADYEEALADQRRLVRELDVLINGGGAAEQASLCDIVAQVKRDGLVTPVQAVPDWQPIETAPDERGIDVWIKSTENPDYGVRVTGVHRVGGKWYGVPPMYKDAPCYLSYWMFPPQPPKESTAQSVACPTDKEK